MGKCNLHRLFTDPATLRSIAPEYLRSLLASHSDGLAAAGLAPPADAGEPPDYEALTRLLMAPEKLPSALREAFFYVHEMATPAGMECLLSAADKAGLNITGRPAPSPADVAVQVWLLAPDLLERKHAEQFIRRLRGLESYHATVWPQPARREFSPAVIEAIANDLNDWFEKRKKGRGVKLFHYPRPDGTWFMVRHGDPFKREGAIDERGESFGVYYWPERFDVVVLDADGDELGIRTPNKSERQKYREVFGRHLYGNADFFGGQDKYTLEPLRDRGPDGLAPIEGMEEVFLTEVAFRWPGSFSELQTHRADDLFGGFAARGAAFPRGLPIIKASFRVRFADSETPRTVTIKPPNVAQYTRDGDSIIIEKWLKLRGFIVDTRAAEYESAA